MFTGFFIHLFIYTCHTVFSHATSLCIWGYNKLLIILSLNIALFSRLSAKTSHPFKEFSSYKSLEFRNHARIATLLGDGSKSVYSWTDNSLNCFNGLETNSKMQRACIYSYFYCLKALQPKISWICLNWAATQLERHNWNFLFH